MSLDFSEFSIFIAITKNIILIMTKKIALILAGSGKADGSEIHEATMTMLAIKQHGADYQAFAPNILQHHVINHLTEEEMAEERNVLVEAARIARGAIKELGEYRAEDYDALIIPGGFGAAKNLCSFAFDGANMQVNKQVEAAIRATHSAHKPIGALCIAPVILAKVLGDVTITLGSGEGVKDAVESWTAKHEATKHGEIAVDERHKVVTTPCYMLDAHIAQVYDGANALVKKVLEYSNES